MGRELIKETIRENKTLRRKDVSERLRWMLGEGLGRFIKSLPGGACMAGHSVGGPGPGQG